MNSLVVGSSSGLGCQLYESISRRPHSSVYGLSRYKNLDRFNSHSLVGNVKRVDFLEYTSQKTFDDLFSELPNFSNIYLTIGGGYGIHSDFPSYEESLLIHKLNSFIPSSIVHSLSNLGKLNSATNIFFISSIATEEITASTGYTAAKSSLNAYSKCIARKKGLKFGAVVLVKLGAMEGAGTSFDRLKCNNINAYEQFVSTRLPYGKPMNSFDVASTLIDLSALPKQILDGMSITIHANESVSL